MAWANDRPAPSDHHRPRPGWRVRLAHWLAPSVLPSAADGFDGGAAEASVWRGLSGQLALRLGVLAEQVRPPLDELEADEEDPERTRLLYEVDHGIARMRRIARDMLVLTDVHVDALGTGATSLLDVVRVAAGGIEYYQRVRIGHVVDVAVPGYAADDLAAVLAALLDNATRYSPGPALIGCRLFADGSMMIQVDDDGHGVDPAWSERLNRALSGPVPPVGANTSLQTGLAVVHRLARKHGLRVALAHRGSPGATGGRGTSAFVIIHRELLDSAGPAAPPPATAAAASGTAHPAAPAPVGAAGSSARPPHAVPGGWPESPRRDHRPGGTVHGLPRRSPSPLRPARSATQQVAPARPGPVLSTSFADDIAAFNGPGPCQFDREEGPTS
ncbi:hypothetical protein GCM10010182_00420 [Actinomadura cremea]|nr:hypothetical protein GCM10010182_00420 [Actinomadura cremea]